MIFNVNETYYLNNDSQHNMLYQEDIVNIFHILNEEDLWVQ